MTDRNQQNDQQKQTAPTGAGTGMQGVDKAPGEETPQTTYNPVQETQRGKNKVDGDPSQESDQPIEQR